MQRLFGRAFTRGRVEDDVLVTIDGDSIVGVELTAGPPQDASRTEGLIAPGFIDVHVHGGDGGDFMDASHDANERVLRLHARHGTTALAATTLSASSRDLSAAVRTIARTASSQTRGVAEIVAVHLEGPYINRDRAGAQDRGSIRVADLDETAMLLDAAPHLRFLMTIAPEIPGVQALIRRFREQIVFSIGHTAADYGEAVAGLAWGATHFTHLFNAMTGLGHRAPGAVGAAMVSADATAEIIADGVHVHPAAIRVAVAAMPGRIVLVTDAMRACGLPEGTYKLYEHDVIVAGGAARLADGTLAGSVLTMDDAVRNMVELVGLPIETALPFATEIPARVAGVSERKGRIAPGCDADLVILDDRLRVQRVWSRGVEVQ